MTSPEYRPNMQTPEHTSIHGALSPAVVAHLAQLVGEAHVQKSYRPVGVALVEDEQHRLLLVQSAKNTNDWWFPQGGIEPGEDAVQALLRESQEEVGILPHQLVLRAFLGAKDLDAEPGRKDKRGFGRGKRYLFFDLAYRGPDTLRIEPSELASYAWVPKHEAGVRTATTRAEKRAMLRGML